MLFSESKAQSQSPEDPNMLPEMQHTFHFKHLNHKSIYLQKFRLYETRSVIASTLSILLVFLTLYLGMIVLRPWFHQLEFVYESFCIYFV